MHYLGSMTKNGEKTNKERYKGGTHPSGTEKQWKLNLNYLFRLFEDQSKCFNEIEIAVMKRSRVY